MNRESPAESGDPVPDSTETPVSVVDDRASMQPEVITEDRTEEPKEDLKDLKNSTKDSTEDSPEQDLTEALPESRSIPLTLLLITGLRVSVKIDNHFITQHSLHIDEPSELTIGALKKCLFMSWQDEWGTAPVNVSNIRLIRLGKVLEDQLTLDHCKITANHAHNVVHMSVKPESFELEIPSKIKSRSGLRNRSHSESSDGAPRSSGCCVIL